MNQYIMKGGSPLGWRCCDQWSKERRASAFWPLPFMTDDDVIIENLPDVRGINVLLEAITGNWRTGGPRGPSYRKD